MKQWQICYAVKTPEGHVTEFDGVGDDPSALYVQANTIDEAITVAREMIMLGIGIYDQMIIYDVGVCYDGDLFTEETEVKPAWQRKP